MNTRFRLEESDNDDNFYHIVVVANDRIWHNDGLTDELVSTRYQDDEVKDDFFFFTFDDCEDGVLVS